ncbi:hypothetical protein [Salmonella phage NINP13076]|nr:hypothetical protein [Salmonella phage NINP13076]
MRLTTVDNPECLERTNTLFLRVLGCPDTPRV